MGCLAETAIRPVFAQIRTIRSFIVDIRQRHVVKIMRTLRATQGERMVINWTTDEAVGVHLHGYDIKV